MNMLLDKVSDYQITNGIKINFYKVENNIIKLLLPKMTIIQLQGYWLLIKKIPIVLSSILLFLQAFGIINSYIYYHFLIWIFTFLVYSYISYTTSVYRYHNYTFFVAYHLDTLIGFISVNNNGFIHHCYITPKYTRKNIGKQLIKLVSKSCYDKKIKSISYCTTNWTYSTKFSKIIPTAIIKKKIIIPYILYTLNIKWNVTEKLFDDTLKILTS